MVDKVRIGTRASRLAVIQANMVSDKIKSEFGSIEIDLVKIRTTGDSIIDKPLYDVGGKALFLKEIEQALVDGSIDVAVHSMKDVPGDVIHPDLIFAGVLERQDPREVFVYNENMKADDIFYIPEGFIFGTSSMRRKVQMEFIHSKLVFTHLRGNVNTRIDKVLRNEVNGTLLAKSGIDRLNMFNHNLMKIISPETIIPSVGQGVIGIQVRKNDIKMIDIIEKINHIETWNLMQIERGFLEYLNADCKTPLAAYARIQNSIVIADFFLANSENHRNQIKRQLKDVDLVHGYEFGVGIAKEFVGIIKGRSA